MAKIAVVIPTYTINEELEEVAIRCIKSLKGNCFVIVSEDGGMKSEKLRDLANLYIYSPENHGFTWNVNRGWKHAVDYDFVAIVNSDIEMVSGSLDALCIDGFVTSPVCENQPVPGLFGAFFVVPKPILIEKGMLIEELKMYYSDTEYACRVRDIFRKVPEVVVRHEQSKTLRAAGLEGGKTNEKDRIIYERLIAEGRAAS